MTPKTPGNIKLKCTVCQMTKNSLNIFQNSHMIISPINTICFHLIVSNLKKKHKHYKRSTFKE